MPMTFTDALVKEHAARVGVEPTREALAKYTENKNQDYIEGWEIRTGRPWNTMTYAEARKLVEQYPECGYIPGIVHILMTKD